MKVIQFENTPLRRRLTLVGSVMLFVVLLQAGLPTAHELHAGDLFRAGCYKIDITPRQLPAIMNGGFLEKVSDRVDDPLFARCLVLEAGEETLGIAIVDSCMIPRALCDAVKQLVNEQTGIAVNRLLIAATHTHSAPSLMDFCLGTRQDQAYSRFVVPQIAAGLRQAHARLEPARAGWAVTSAPEHTHCRRWLRRTGTSALDPFGLPSVRAMMHPGYENPEYAGPAGPVDNDLTVLSLQATDGRPLCLLANFSMHYFGGTAGFSADYFGDFARHVESQLAGASETDGFVAIMSQGTSGDLHWMDYSQPKRVAYSRQQYAAELAEIAIAAVESIDHRTDIELAMAETQLTLQRRLPSADRLAWARQLNQRRGQRPPSSRPEVYAQQAEWIDAHRSAELVLQTIRIGGLAIAAMPNEVFAVTGLRLKAQSPLQPLMNLELANGAEGYIPPPEQHYLGGYTTWPARTAGLETSAEPQIVESLLTLLEQVSAGKTRRPLKRDLYNEQQRAALAQAKAADNNRENR